MPRITTRSASARQLNQDKVTASNVQQINQLNKKAELGSVSARFYRTGSEGFYPKSKELTPEQALVELMAGHEVECTAVTWRTYNTRGKSGITSSRKVRTKIRGADKQKFTNVKGFEKWWSAVEKDVAAAKAADGDSGSSTTTRTRTRTGKSW